MLAKNKIKESFSLLDRFELAATSSQATLDDIVAGIVRDVEALLNTRNNRVVWADEKTDLTRSILGYGLADFRNFNLAASNGQRLFCDHIAELIRYYEPRLANPNVNVAKSSDSSLSWELSISAELKLPAQDYTIALASVIEQATGRYHLQGVIHDKAA